MRIICLPDGTPVLTLATPRSQIKVSYERSEAADEQVRNPTFTDSEKRWGTVLDRNFGLPLITLRSHGGASASN